MIDDAHARPQIEPQWTRAVGRWRGSWSLGFEPLVLRVAVAHPSHYRRIAERHAHLPPVQVVGANRTAQHFEQAAAWSNRHDQRRQFCAGVNPNARDHPRPFAHDQLYGRIAQRGWIGSPGYARQEVPTRSALDDPTGIASALHSPPVIAISAHRSIGNREYRRFDIIV